MLNVKATIVARVTLTKAGKVADCQSAIQPIVNRRYSRSTGSQPAKALGQGPRGTTTQAMALSAKRLKTKLLGALVLSLSLAANGLGQPQSSQSPLVVIVLGENEYHTWETLPRFASQELHKAGLRVAFVQASSTPGDNAFTNYAAIKSADLIVLSVRRRTPPIAMMRLLRDHLKAGKPLVGIRTASHAFGAEPSDQEHDAWPEFDRQVLGATYEGHYNNGAPTGKSTRVKAAASADAHPILAGIPKETFTVSTSLYKYRALAGTVTVLMTGQVEGQSEREPVAWVNTAENRRIFYTSLGGAKDFEQPFFRQLLLNGILWALNRPGSQ